MRKHQPECGNIGRNRGNISPNAGTSPGTAETSARMREHRPESWKHQPERENIGRKRGNISPNARTSSRMQELDRESNLLVTSHFLSTTKFKKQRTLRRENLLKNNELF
ncbi:hypothetical protein [Lentibacillus sp. Marseille-P4043]|uniref:hypothetical protein n=1 Tax=Lentibacillus sp. Marseille-P4043 TaxID=2040293 RepID=UPI000D0B33B7|nr:hypothetical protein [Lentibacillus sp. Marseille-P4043]